MRVPIIDMEVDVTSVDEVLNRVETWFSAKQGRYICVSNVHMCMEVFDNQEYAEIVNNSDLAVADGKPISIAQRMLGHKKAQQVRGEDLTLALCDKSVSDGFAVGFFGATDQLLNELEGVLNKRFPGINIGYSFAPPFRPVTAEEDAEYVQAINDSGVSVLFVGLGCPKQEIWMAEHRDKLNCVMLGVGAAFDFIAGNKKNAPRWMRKIGLEWLFRLLSEPRRLWKRYLKHNPRFVWYFMQQLLGRDFRKKS